MRAPSLVDLASARRQDEQCAAALLEPVFLPNPARTAQQPALSRQHHEVLSGPIYAQQLVKISTDVCFICERPRQSEPCRPPWSSRWRNGPRARTGARKLRQFRLPRWMAVEAMQWSAEVELLERTEYSKTVVWGPTA